MQVEVVKWGNSSAIRLPAVVLKDVRVALGDCLELTTENGKLVLEPTQKKYHLEDMLGRITKKNIHTCVAPHSPVGREVW
jgi:antitoxin component of MazEF toxin-antitoxin module